MCVSVPRKVVRVIKDKAELEDGRTVRLGLVKEIRPGDYLEVYGDIALAKVPEKDPTAYKHVLKND